jgi:heme oxygenase
VGFLTEARNQAKKTGRHATKMAQIEDKLGSKDWKEFLAALSDHSISCAAIARAIQNRGIDIAENTVLKMRRTMVDNVNK